MTKHVAARPFDVGPDTPPRHFEEGDVIPDDLPIDDLVSNGYARADDEEAPVQEPETPSEDTVDEAPAVKSTAKRSGSRSRSKG